MKKQRSYTQLAFVYVNLYTNGAANCAWYRTEAEAKANILKNLDYMGTFAVNIGEVPA